MKSLVSTQLRSGLTKVFWITFVWLLIGTMMFFIGYSTMINYNCDISQFDLGVIVKGNLLSTLFAGLLGEGLVVFLWEGWLRTKPYGVTLFHFFWTFTIIFFLVNMVGWAFIETQNSEQSFLHPDVREAILFHVFGINQLVNYLFWLCTVLSTLIFFQVNDKYGPGGFKDFLSGKYFHPKREERIFMFLDLRGSTTIAEQLGEVRYFNFVNEVFKEVTPPILQSLGEIYRYVGDEIIISWRMNKGLQDANCIQCFVEVEKLLNQKKSIFLEKYGVVPEFKAGVHYGHVMTREMGVIKRDIAFSDDVLNTTARIQSMCNDYGVNILFSKTLLKALSFSQLNRQPREIGNILLKGKKEKVFLYTI